MKYLQKEEELRRLLEPLPAEAEADLDDFITYDDPDAIWILKNPLNKIEEDYTEAQTEQLEKIESGNPDVDDVIRLLEKDEIFCSNPQKHWEKNKIQHDSYRTLPLL